MRKILRNKTIAAVLILTLLVMVLTGWKVYRAQASADWRSAEIDGYDWLVPLGQYDLIYGATLEDDVYYRAASVLLKDSMGTAYVEAVLDEEGRELENFNGSLDRFTIDYRHLMVELHPAGYGLTEVDYTGDKPSDWEVRDLTGKLLYADGGWLTLTEEPGYVISADKRSVIDLFTGDTVFTAPSNERIKGQAGGFWQMELDLPWYDNGDTLTVEYLRDMDFQVALDGKLSSGYSQILQDGLIIGDIVVNGTYYNWPSEYIEVDWCVLDSETGLPAEGFENLDISAFSGAEDGWFAVRNEEGCLRMYFTDGEGGFLDLPKGVRPVGPLSEGIFPAAYNERTDSPLMGEIYNNSDRCGFMDRQGNLVTELIFERCSPVREDCAVVQYDDKVGILRLKGGVSYEGQDAS